MELLDIPEDEYHADTTRISASMIKMMHAKTPAHVYDAFFAPDREQPDSAALDFGKMFHAAVLEPETFDDKYMVMPEGLDRRTNEGKALWADIFASGKQAVADNKFNDVKKMAANIHKLPIWSKIMANNPQFEKTVRTDRKRIRMDIFVEPCDDFPRGLIGDLKSCADASPYRFGYDCHKFGYHIQAAYYRDTVFHASGFKPSFKPAFIILACEKTRPFVAKAYELGQIEIDIGWAIADYAYRNLFDCIKSNNWPGYGDEIEPIELPFFAYDDEEIFFGDE